MSQKLPNNNYGKTSSLNKYKNTLDINNGIKEESFHEPE